jgi:hypothetical protein
VGHVASKNSFRLSVVTEHGVDIDEGTLYSLLLRVESGKEILRRSRDDDYSCHPQPLALFGDGFVTSLLKLGFPLVPLRLQPFTYRLLQHREPSIAH